VSPLTLDILIYHPLIAGIDLSSTGEFVPVTAVCCHTLQTRKHPCCFQQTSPLSLHKFAVTVSISKSSSPRNPFLYWRPHHGGYHTICLYVRPLAQISRRLLATALILTFFSDRTLKGIGIVDGPPTYEVLEGFTRCVKITHVYPFRARRPLALETGQQRF
jgi:hypothetical protein